ncbi:hypothetical protein SCP_1100830 [Sparassis crispa]|uniref:Uncharacterized protein n=1 Tax=Sparassis crispa TaxID=139825 RepID=A0A401GZ16_9APHY|nr:hypothetical protein SCP_1100830 [Sparassis crispa]GBE87407.1 hypothetical protein SCP_1100830 [Sparassis crispa]
MISRGRDWERRSTQIVKHDSASYAFPAYSTASTRRTSPSATYAGVQTCFSSQVDRLLDEQMGAFTLLNVCQYRRQSLSAVRCPREDTQDTRPDDTI